MLSSLHKKNPKVLIDTFFSFCALAIAEDCLWPRGHLIADTSEKMIFEDV